MDKVSRPAIEEISYLGRNDHLVAVSPLLHPFADNFFRFFVLANQPNGV